MTPDDWNGMVIEFGAAFVVLFVVLLLVIAFFPRRGAPLPKATSESDEE